MEYRIKWKNYPHKSNTWEPVDNLIDCQSAIDEFESKWAREIVGMDGNKFVMRFKCGEDRAISYSEAKIKWSSLLIAFNQNCLYWYDSTNKIDDSHVIEESLKPVTDLDEIICKFFSNEVFVFCILHQHSNTIV